MKFNRTGYWLLALFGGGGLLIFAMGLVVPATAFVALPLGGAWCLAAVGLVVYAWQQSRKAQHERWLFENGIRGSARILEASYNAEVNGQPVMKLDLEIEVPGQAPRQRRHSMLMSKFAAYRMRPGVVLPVHVNPRDENDLLVRW